MIGALVMSVSAIAVEKPPKGWSGGPWTDSKGIMHNDLRLANTANVVEGFFVYKDFVTAAKSDEAIPANATFVAGKNASGRVVDRVTFIGLSKGRAAP